MPLILMGNSGFSVDFFFGRLRGVDARFVARIASLALVETGVGNENTP
jgi:hypothetical protein